MFNPHSLNGPEITTVLAALGLVANASASFYMALKKSAQRPGELRLQALRVKSKRTSPSNLANDNREHTPCPTSTTF